jgi:hypothetical protein
MARRIFFLLVFSGLIVFSGCGKKGPIEPPLARLPQTVQGFSLFQRGDKVLLNWTNPEAYIDGNPIGKVAEVEIWLIKENRAVGTAAKKWTTADFENKAELLIRISADQFSTFHSLEPEQTGLTYVYAPKTEEFGHKVLTFALRVKDGEKRTSAFSEPSSLVLLPPPAPPQNVLTEVFEDHIQVRWKEGEEVSQATGSAKPAGYNLYRSVGDVPARRLNSALITQPEYSDKDFSFGQTYRYFVRTVLESAPPVESEDSQSAEVSPRDTFPPRPPTGLAVIGGSGFIALSWEANRESDLGGYRVWRRLEGKGEFVLIAKLTAAESSFQDTRVEKNSRYEYAITALDTAGNESQKSEPARGIVRNNPPA